MQNELIKHQRWVYLFICTHLLCWTLIPALVRANLPLDAIEGTTWGAQLQWGYDKNPFLNAWLTALAIKLNADSGWVIYLFSQISVAVCLWVVWELGRKMLPPIYAFIAVLLLEGVQYFNFHAIDFNDNTLELGLWALAIYFFYRALQTPTYWLWALTGFFSGVGMMAKYYTAALLTAMALFLFFNSESRKQLKTPFPYFGLIIFFIVILPHTIWLFFHDFITVTYVFNRASSPPHWWNHFFFPAQFTWQQLQVFLPAMILLALLLIGKKPLLSPKKTALSAFNRSFLIYVGFGPFLLTILLSLFLGIKLRAGWGMPLLSFWSIAVLSLIQPHITQTKIYTFIGGTFILMGTLLSAYAYSLMNSKDTCTANFPGREIAKTITAMWHDTYHTKLAYVGGSRWVGGNIGFYSSDHPAVFIEWDRQRAPWIDVTDLKQKGAVFIWSISDKESMPASVAAKFPSLSQTKIMTFAWQRNKSNLPPVKIGVALLSPEKISD